MLLKRPTNSSAAAVSLGKTLFVGIGIGAVAAIVLVVVSYRNWVADYLQIPVTLMLVIAAFTGANLFEIVANV